jgi:phosphoenolpyruvate-protein kinase (PTS system EI component)
MQDEIKDKKIRDERVKTLKKDLDKSKIRLAKDVAKVSKKADATLIEISDAFFDSLIETVTDTELQREIAFTKNRMTYIINNINI